MARKYKAYFEEKKAVEYSIDIPDLEKYKDAWLVLCNNAREYPKDIFKVSNNSSSTIYVLANPDSNIDFKSWLSQFSEDIKEYHDKVAVVIDVECDYTKSFDEDYIDSEYVLGETD